MSQYSPSRSTIGLTSQQKDLIITHLKSEVYELKQQDRDYKSLQNQIFQQEQKLSNLTDQRSYAEKDYVQKINGQEKEKQQLKSELNELERMTMTKERENHEMRDKLNKNLDKNEQVESNYGEARENNDRISQHNAQLKDDIVELSDRIQDEKQKGGDLKISKDKLGHKLYKVENEVEKLKEKEQELRRKLNDRERDQGDLEQRWREMEREQESQDFSMEKNKNSIIDEKKVLNNMKDQIDNITKSIHRAEEQKKMLQQQQQAESMRGREFNARINDLTEKDDRREQEFKEIQRSLQEIQYDNNILREKYESLLLERDALERHGNQIDSANKEVERELDNFVRADDSICKALEERDDRLSPIRQSPFQNVASQRSFHQPTTSSHNYNRQPSNNLLAGNNDQQQQQQQTYKLQGNNGIQTGALYQPNFNMFSSQLSDQKLGGVRFEDQQPTRESIGQRNAQPLRFLNPKNIEQQNIASYQGVGGYTGSNQYTGSGLGQSSYYPTSDIKRRSSPLRSPNRYNF